MNTTIPIWARRFALRYLRAIGLPDDDPCFTAIRNQDWRAYLHVKVDPRSYTDPLSYFRAASAASILKKYVGLPTGLDTKAAAVQTWWAGEEQCYRTNIRLIPYLPGQQLNLDREAGIHEFFAVTRKIVRGWLGRAPTLEALCSEGRFGPGTTLSDKMVRDLGPTHLEKTSSQPTLTPGCVPLAQQWVKTAWAASVAACQGQPSPEVSLARGNRHSTVPKTGLTDRSIGVEPSINVFYQLALGRLIRRRLSDNAGWNLSMAQDIHRQVAYDCSVVPTYATLDLSNASDTLCRNLVRLLLPPSWLALLDALRSPTTEIGGKVVYLDKFSSMGNGFTFELETLVFAALCSAVLKKHGGWGQLGMDLFVFGDDIIVPDCLVREVSAVLAFCGFKLNESKSFFGDVPFRESCGADYFRGVSVRPLYLKEEPNEPPEFISLANRISAINSSLAQELGFSPSLDAWNFVLSSLPARIRHCYGPKGLGDVVIHTDELLWKYKWRNSIRLFQCVLPGKPRIRPFSEFHPLTVLACALYGSGGSDVGGLTPRQTLRGYRVERVPYS